MVAKKSDDQVSTASPDFVYDPKAKTLKIKTANDTYEISKPTGKLGGLHFRLLTKAMPKNQLQEEGVPAGNMSPADQDRLQEVFVDWIDQVLPKILTSHKYEDVPGEDQWILYLASFKLMNVSGELFRIVG